MDERNDILVRVAEAILAHARHTGHAVRDWYLNDHDYEDYLRAAKNDPARTICGAAIHREPKT